MSRAGFPREPLIDKALGLVVESEVAPPASAEAARTRLLRWAAASPEHQAAEQEARRRWSALEGMSASLRGHFNEAPRDGGEPAPRRRKALLSIAALLGGAALTAQSARSLWQLWQEPIHTASYRTRPAELLGVDVPDGSHIDLGADSRIDISLYRRRRVVRMNGGDLRLDVAHDSARPLEVLTGGARIEVVGTVFSVRDRGGAVTVAVERGHVRVQAREPGASTDDAFGPAVDLRAGQLLDVRDGRIQPPRQGDTAALAAWREGWLVFQDTPLGEALATVNAYRDKPITAADPQAAAMRLSGRFPARDATGLLAALPVILPLAVRQKPDGSIELAAR